MFLFFFIISFSKVKSEKNYLQQFLLPLEYLRYVEPQDKFSEVKKFSNPVDYTRRANTVF